MPAAIPGVMTVFDHVHELDSPAERQAYLDQTCGDYPEVRREVEALLRALDRAGNFLQQPAILACDTDLHNLLTTDDVAPADPTLDVDLSGTRIGPYRLIERLGQGGMGAVYKAAQEEPIRRQVALKVIRQGMASAHVVARFEVERQALTLMDHPSIARVYDAGTTEAGLPYYAMELVEGGASLTHFCDQHSLPLRDRLALFVQVCQAIQHAHQNMIIHRDLKPANILVAWHESKPLARVIDFGLAKALEPDLIPHSDLTQIGSIAGTPAYMSPEQVRPGNHGIDARTDIYSLGVILFELLVGTTPLDAYQTKEIGWGKVFEWFSTQEPPRPSVQVAQLADRLAGVAAARAIEPGKLARALANELDWVVLRALEKERDRRYETASELAREVQRYLDDEPVEARPPTLGYQLGKFARRHWRVLGVVCGFVAMLLVGIAGLLVALAMVDAARNRAVTAEKGSRVAVNTYDALVQALTANRTRLAEGEKAILRNLLRHEDEPEAGSSELATAKAAEIRLRRGNIHALVGEGEAALKEYGKASTLYEKLAQDAPGTPSYRHELARCHFNRAIVLAELGKHAEVEASYGQAITLYEQLSRDHADDPRYRRDLADSLNSLGAVLRDREDLPGARKAFERAITLGQELLRERANTLDDGINLAGSTHNLGNVLRDQGEVQTSLERYGTAIGMLNQLPADNEKVRLFLRNAHWDRASALEVLKLYDQAFQDWKLAIALDDGRARDHLRRFAEAAGYEAELRSQPKISPEMLYQGAALHALATGAAREEREGRLEQRHASRALELLERVRAAGGFGKPDKVMDLREDPMFAALAPHQAYKDFLRKLELAARKD